MQKAEQEEVTFYYQIKKILINRLFITAIFIAASISTSFADLNESIPQDLKQWESWVLKDQKSIQCPLVYNRNTNICAYPDRLTIDLKESSGYFEQEWTVYARSWVSLPGNNKIWPENVRVNQKSLPVISRNNRPSVELQEGRYKITGEFNWQQMPGSLSIPEETALIGLSIANKKIKQVDFRSGRLWLKSTSIKPHQNNRLDIQVFRKITDSIPLRVTTHIKLDVSGQQREIVLEGALLEGFSAGSVDSRLPSLIDKNGRLKIQIRPGQWWVEVAAYNSRPLKAIALNEFTKPWPDNEIWVLEAQPHLRLIKVLDKNSIDPSQTQLPQDWKALPAYTLKSGEQLRFDVLKRGDPEPEPDQLTLSKKIWLDFNGNGLTVNDKITGKLSREWRLNASDIRLGKVTLNGKPQFITENNNGREGVEVRHGNLDLSADSRIEGGLRSFSASGWDMDFTEVNAMLHLPVGWKLISVSGANADETWVKQWTLLDLFIVLLTSIVIYKIFGLKWGAIALITLTLVWHEYGAPQYIWLNLVVAVALLRVIPVGRIFKVVRSYQIIVSIFLLIILLPFMVDQVRSALHPQLEFSNMSANSEYGRRNVEKEVFNAAGEAPAERLKSRVESDSPVMSFSSSVRPDKKLLSRSSVTEYALRREKAKQMVGVDPDAMIQTGPGLPSWNLQQYYISWDGPVRRDQKISMVLLSPGFHALFKVLQVCLVLLLAWRLLDIASFKLHGPNTGADKSSGNSTDSNDGKATTIKSVITVMLMSALFSMAPLDAEAAFPSEKLLQELQEELTKPAECLPECASIESMSINLTAKELSISLRLHAQEDVLLPLPVPIKQWLPEIISIDGKRATGLIRKDNSTLWLRVNKGLHRLKISGRVDHLNQLQFSFPLKPHGINLKIKGWTSQGMDKASYKITALTFFRIVDKSNTSVFADIEQTAIPVYAQVTRSISLGLEWYVTTRVVGLSGSAYPVILSIPLLEGESVITDNIKVKDAQAIITLASAGRSYSWTSKLKHRDQITLQASEKAPYIERWTLEVSPLWHIRYKGTPVIYHQRQGNNWRPEWSPWPGEKLLIQVDRPKGVKGKTLTIDSSTLTLQPGEQMTAAKLVFNLRSSLGGQHVIHLPADADLQSVKINKQNMPLRVTEQGLSLPVMPGKQNIEIEWRESRGISSVFKSSEINLGVESVNNVINIKPGYNRWVLFVAGPTMGPAVLFWGVFIVILIVAYALGRIKGTPLNSLQWMLLGTGLSASGPWVLAIVAVSIFALRLRGRLSTAQLSALLFNLMQLGLLLLVFVSVSTLLFVIQQGLLGSPDMQITGNGSYAYELNWFSDRINAALPLTTTISVADYIFRLMMLAWSIWLAFAVIKWAQWGWGCYTQGEYWRSRSASRDAKNKSEKEKHIKSD